MKTLLEIGRFPLAALLALLGALMLAGAMAFEHWGGFAPCALCIDQRKAWGAVILTATLAAWAEGRSRIAVSLLFLGLAGLAALIGAGIAGFHVGVEQKWWEGVAACGAGFSGFSEGGVASIREQLLQRPVVRCDEVAWSMLGVSMAGWNGLISLAAGSGALYVVLRDLVRIRAS